MLIAFILTSGFVACRSHRHVVTPPVTDSTPVAQQDSATVKPTATVRLDTIRDASFNTYCANYSCTVDGVNVNGQIRIEHDSIIWISINKIIEVGRIMLTPTHVKAYVRIANKYYDGDYATLSRRFGIDIDYYTLEALLTGNCQRDCRKSKEPVLKDNTVSLFYNQSSKATAKERQVVMNKDYKSKKLTSVQLTSTTPRQKILCIYNNLQTYSGQQLATTIDVELYSSHLNVITQLKLEKINLNGKQQYPFKIPSVCKAV